MAITAMATSCSPTKTRAPIRDAFKGAAGLTIASRPRGWSATAQPGGTVLEFATDMCIVELVDARNQPVPDGTASAKVLLTNLHNRTQPLIRYELSDRFIRHPAAGDPYLHAAVEGRADDAFQFGAVTIDPLMIRTVMVKTPNAVEYQVRQTDRGIDVAVVADGVLDHAALTSALEHSLRRRGPPTTRACGCTEVVGHRPPSPDRQDPPLHRPVSTPGGAMPDLKAHTQAFYQAEVFNEHDLQRGSRFRSRRDSSTTTHASAPPCEAPEGARHVFNRLWAGCETGLITEHLAVRDDVTVFRQLGALPAAMAPTDPAPARQAC